MTANEKAIIELLKKNRGIMRFSEILAAGFDPSYLVSLQEEKLIEKMGRGFYRLVGSPELSNPDLVTAALKAPHGVVCLISALAFHEVTSEIPHRVDLAIPKGARENKIDYPPLEFYHFSEEAWKAGIETHTIDGHRVKVYSLAKTVADCFKFRNKIGADIALGALKAAVNEKKIQPKNIMSFAKVCRVANIIKPYLEMMF